MEELNIFMRDINEKERERLFHQIVKVEQEEDDLRSIKKRHEQSLENFVGEFRSISRNAENRLSATPQNRKFIEETRELELKVEKYVDNQLNVFNQEMEKQFKNLDKKREKLIQERNGLPWE